VNKYIIWSLLLITIIFTGCNNNHKEVKLLDENFLKTKVGRVIEQKMSKEILVIKEPIAIKKVLKKRKSKKMVI